MPAKGDRITKRKDEHSPAVTELPQLIVVLTAVYVKIDPAGWRELAGRMPRPPNRFALTENPVPKPGDQY